MLGAFTLVQVEHMTLEEKLKQQKDIVDMEFVNNVITSDITNVYNDSDAGMLHLIHYLHIRLTQSIIPNATTM